MPDINPPPPTQGVGWRREGQNDGGGRKGRGSAFSRAAQAYGAARVAPPHDITSLHGIPTAELTPSVRHALEDLMGDVDRFRWALEQAEGRQAYLEGLADRDALLPVLNRRAFDRELNLVLQAAGTDRDAGTPPVLGLFYLANFEALHAEQGIAAAEAALRHMADVLVSGVGRADVVGATGGAGVGVVLTMLDPITAGSRVAALRDAVTAYPPRHEDGDLVLDVRAASVILEPGMTPESAVEAADARMRAASEPA
ncbi:GGDEF domain protein [Caenispirillum salinarum AK4]|uniref:GGDEF domain protein n=1 Tax=Caenispirillum salinarum AK4 TaxID=1238182 RepID=K9GKC1_9PROT|nr:GGDEF domain-containing protein [Caenispirillum salinarum]EKV26475.1 GGDEF domain protein [Caenispirillum salinarum AK4]